MLTRMVLHFFFAGLFSLGLPYIWESFQEGEWLYPILTLIFFPLNLFCGIIALMVVMQGL